MTNMDNDPEQPVWPPSPTIDAPAATSPSREDIRHLVGSARICATLGIILCAFLHIGTIGYGLKANRLAGRGVATGYIVVGVVHLAVVAVVLIMSLIRSIAKTGP